MIRRINCEETKPSHILTIISSSFGSKLCSLRRKQRKTVTTGSPSSSCILWTTFFWHMGFKRDKTQFKPFYVTARPLVVLSSLAARPLVPRSPSSEWLLSSLAARLLVLCRPSSRPSLPVLSSLAAVLSSLAACPVVPSCPSSRSSLPVLSSLAARPLVPRPGRPSSRPSQPVLSPLAGGICVICIICVYLNELNCLSYLKD